MVRSIAHAAKLARQKWETQCIAAARRMQRVWRGHRGRSQCVVSEPSALCPASLSRAQVFHARGCENFAQEAARGGIHKASGHFSPAAGTDGRVASRRCAVTACRRGRRRAKRPLCGVACSKTLSGGRTGLFDAFRFVCRTSSCLRVFSNGACRRIGADVWRGS